LLVACVGFVIGDGRSLPVATTGGAVATGRATGADYAGEARAPRRLRATRTNSSRQGRTDDSDSQTWRTVTVWFETGDGVIEPCPRGSRARSAAADYAAASIPLVI